MLKFDAATGKFIDDAQSAPTQDFGGPAPLTSTTGNEVSSAAQPASYDFGKLSIDSSLNPVTSSTPAKEEVIANKNTATDAANKIANVKIASAPIGDTVNNDAIKTPGYDQATGMPVGWKPATTDTTQNQNAGGTAPAGTVANNGVSSTGAYNDSISLALDPTGHTNGSAYQKQYQQWLAQGASGSFGDFVKKSGSLGDAMGTFGDLNTTGLYDYTKDASFIQAQKDLANVRAGIFTPDQQNQIKQQGETAGNAYDPLIANAEESKRQGMSTATVGAGRKGGFMNTQYSGLSALAPQDAGWTGAGGELENVKSAYDRNIDALENAKQNAISKAEDAAKTAMQTGKSEDLATLKDAFDAANNIYTQQQQLINERVTAIANAQSKQMVKLSAGASYFDPTTGQMVTAPNKPGAPKFFTDSNGQVVRYDPDTNEQTSLGELGKKSSTISQDDITSLADGVMSGQIPPDLKGLYKYGGPVRAELARRGFDLTTAGNDYLATQKFITASNSTQQLRMKQAESSVENSLGNLEQLNSDYERSGYKFVNKADLIAATNGVMGPDAAKKAQALLGQIALITDELGQTFMGGNSPTDAAFGLASQVLQGDFSKDTLGSQINLIKQNLQFRKNSWAQVQPTSVGGGDNQYNAPAGGNNDGLNVDWGSIDTSDF